MTARLRFRWRVLLHGAVLVTLMAGMMTICDRLFLNPVMQQSYAERSAWVAEHALVSIDDRAALTRELAAAKARIGADLTVYGPGGELLGSNVSPPLIPPPRASWPLLARHPILQQDQLLTAGLMRDGALAAVIVTDRGPNGPPPQIIVFVLGSCALATLLASIPLARSVIRPIEELQRAVRQFGKGEMSTRVGFRRGDEIGELAAAFDEMASQVEMHVRTEKQLLASVSHELRTPLARIRVVLELASDGDPSRVQSCLGEIAHDLAELERLIDDVLTTTRLTLSSSVPLHLGLVDPSQLVDQSRARFASLYPERDLRLRVDGAAFGLRCDAVLLRRAIDNLLDNAVKHAPGSRVDLALRMDSENVEFEVRDLGPGMRAADAASAFEPFYRVDHSRDRRTGGVGLGLSIVRRIVQAHGGEIHLETAPGRGTAVTVRLPRGKDAALKDDPTA